MKDYRKINNLDTLEKEIYFLERESKILGEKLNSNFGHFKKNCMSMTINTILSKTNNSKKGFWKSFLETAGITKTVNIFSENIAAKAAEAFRKMTEKFFTHKER